MHLRRRMLNPWPQARVIKYVLAWLMMIPFLTFAQTKTISGTVKDDAGKPLQGVSVTVKGKSGGMQTNDMGKFSISATGTDILIFSSIGFETYEIRVGNNSSFSISLKAASNALNDVVVIGYGSVKRKDLTGSVGTAPIKDMQLAPVGNITEALAGRVAGVVVSSADGQPGVLPTIVVRGNNSITGDNSPLYVIDGFPIENANIGALNPEDIESMEILKDASATAVYGARGANGVVVITTKKGKSGAPVVNFSSTYGTQSISKKMPLMTPYEYVQNLRERDSLGNNYATINNVLSQYYATDISYGTITVYNPATPGIPTIIDKYGIGNLEKYKPIPGLDLQDAMNRTAPFQTYDLSIMGGNDKTKYALSGNYLNQDGIVINSGYRRYTGRLVLDQTVNDKLKVGVNAAYAYLKSWGGSPTQNGTTGYYGSSSAPLYQIYGYRPVTALDSTGKQTSNLLDNFLDPNLRTNSTAAQFLNIINPVINQNHSLRQAFQNNLSANGYIEYKIVPSLTLRINGGITTNQTRSEQFYDTLTLYGSPYTAAGASNGANGSVIYSQTNSWFNSNLLTYDKTFINKHHLNVLGVVEESGNKSYAYGFSAFQITNPSLGISALDNSGSNRVASATSTNNTLMSFLGRINYDYEGKYYLTASFRADGSSKFAPGNKWGYFPSTAFKWRFIEEPFIKDNSILSDGNLRISWGQTGNNRGISDFPYLPAITTSSSTSGNGYYVVNGNLVPGFYPGSLANPGIKWETVTETNIAADLGFLNNRINVTAEVYKKKSKDLLLNASLPGSLGFSSVFANVGSIENKGLELNITTTNIQTRDFKWTSAFNIAWNKSKVLSLVQGQESLQNSVGWDAVNYNNITTYITKVGQPLGQMYGLVFDGLYQASDFNYSSSINTSAANAGKGSHWILKDEVPTNGAARAAIQPGDIKFKDLNGDGIINSSDLTVIGRGLPIHTGGFGNNFSYKGFSLNIFFQWSYGNNIENANRYIFEGNINNAPALNQFSSYNNRWTPANTNTNIPRNFGSGPLGYYNSRVIEDGSYLRLKTVDIGYNLPASLLKKAKIRSVRIFASAQNLVTWTKYTGQDPEINVYNSVLTPNFDWSGYGRARTIVFGANLSF
jgi:TonB-linked SusC/RagA family outer membrane protein